MSKVSRDLLRVTPAKIEEARKRADLIAEYAALPHPTTALAQAYAKRLEISKAQFYLLLRIYREHGTIFPPKKVDAARRQSRIDPRLDQLINKTIKALGADAPTYLITRAVNERSDALALPRASENAVRWRVQRARRRNRGSRSYPPLVVDRSALNLNINYALGTAAAWLTAVIHAPTGGILGYHLSIGDAGPAEAALALHRALGTDEAPKLPLDTIDGAIMLFQDLHPGWEAMTMMLENAGFSVVGPKKARIWTGSALHRLLGDGIARFAFRPRTAPHQPAAKGGSGIEFATAEQLVQEAIAPYRPAALERITDERLSRLKERLQLLIEGDHAR